MTDGVGGGGGVGLPRPSPLDGSITIYAKTTVHCSPDSSLDPYFSPVRSHNYLSVLFNLVLPHFFLLLHLLIIFAMLISIVYVRYLGIFEAVFICAKVVLFADSTGLLNSC